MRLGISSAVAPDASLNALVQACRHRGLTTLELRSEDAHGVDPHRTATEDQEAPTATARQRRVEIVGLRTDGDAHGLQPLARELDVPVILAGPAPLANRIARARALEAEGVRSLVEVRGDSSHWLRAVAEAGVAVAWTIDGSTPDPGAHLDEMRTAGVSPRYLRMAGGGGPESAMGEGRGIGAVMARLALDRFTGPVILSPGSSRYRVAWSTWLGRRGGWGCGGSARSSGPTQITLPSGGGVA